MRFVKHLTAYKRVLVLKINHAVRKKWTETSLIQFRLAIKVIVSAVFFIMLKCMNGK